MKIGILGDIHGNNIALKSVLKKARLLNVDRLLITGDLVGYYYGIKEVLDLLDQWEWTSVRGNHEDMLKNCIADRNSFFNVNKKYGSALERTIDQVTKTQLEMLINFPHPKEFNIDNNKLLLCHGSPWDNNEYIYPDADHNTLKKCALKGYDLVILGHTHYPMVKSLGFTNIINPGSVGQCRDRNREFGAKWALYNTETKEVSLHSEYYDPSEIINKVNEYDPQLTYLSRILTRK